MYFYAIKTAGFIGLLSLWIGFARAIRYDQLSVIWTARTVKGLDKDVNRTDALIRIMLILFFSAALGHLNGNEERIGGAEQRASCDRR